MHIYWSSTTTALFTILWWYWTHAYVYFLLAPVNSGMLTFQVWINSSCVIHCKSTNAYAWPFKKYEHWQDAKTFTSGTFRHSKTEITACSVLSEWSAIDSTKYSKPRNQELTIKVPRTKNTFVASNLCLSAGLTKEITRSLPCWTNQH